MTDEPALSDAGVNPSLNPRYGQRCLTKSRTIDRVWQSEDNHQRIYQNFFSLRAETFTGDFLAETKVAHSASCGADVEMLKFRPSIAMRLVVIVLATGILAFAVIGSLAVLRLDLGLKEQADSLGELSAKQLSDRLDGEAQLARARIETLGSEVASRLRQLAQRADVTKAVASRNDVTIQQLLAAVATTSDMQRLIAFDKDGIPIGVNETADLLAISSQLYDSDLARDLLPLLKDNSRGRPRGHQSTHAMSMGLLGALHLPARLTIAHEAFEPVFDDFGEIIGALGGFRALGRTERTLENFSSLTNAGVVIMHGREVVSGAGPKARFAEMTADDNGLIFSDDHAHVARCVDYDSALKVCAFTDASIVTATRDQMFRIGATETRLLMQQFLAVAAITLLMLVVSLLVGVRYATFGLSTLAVAARGVADGDLDRPFKPVGVGEIFTLGLAFERMLENLRTSMGQIRQLAFFDGITGLPNREKIRADAKKIFDQAKSGALCFLDLDGFKSINDTYGHKTGDLLLRKVAERLSAFFDARNAADGSRSKRPTLARIGGDEFVIIIPAEQDRILVASLLKDLLTHLGSPFELGGSSVNIGASIGVTFFPSEGTSYEALLMNADLAMYVAKQRGRNTFSFFEPELLENARTKLALERDLRTAIREKTLSVNYQPIIKCGDGSIRGVEALARWEHPVLGNIPPIRFITIAEEVGLVQEVDRFVMQRAIEDIGRLIAAGADIVLATNVSAASIEDAFFVNQVSKVIEKSSFDPTRLELEITESVAMHDPDKVCQNIDGLRKMGVRFAIDDFGAGYSNLATLARLPFDTVKLDRSLVYGVAADREKQAIVRTGVTLAAELGFETVVEGIENSEDLEFAATTGATYAQGYLFSKPVAIDALSILLKPSRLAVIAGEALNREFARTPRGRQAAR
jgi:diguanylate cyclase (GGDEF)-like protein